MASSNFTDLLLNANITGFPSNVTANKPSLNIVGSTVLDYVNMIRSLFFDTEFAFLSISYWLGVLIVGIIPLVFTILVFIGANMCFFEELVRHILRYAKNAIFHGRARKRSKLRWTRRYIGITCYMAALLVLVAVAIPSMAGVNNMTESLDNVGLLAEEGVVMGKTVLGIANGAFDMVNYTFYTLDRFNATIMKYLPTEEFLNQTISCILNSLQNGPNATNIMNHISNMDIGIAVDPDCSMDDTLAEFNETLNTAPNASLVFIGIENINATLNSMPSTDLVDDMNTIGTVRDSTPNMTDTTIDTFTVNITLDQSASNISDASIRSENMTNYLPTLFNVLNHTIAEDVTDLSTYHGEFDSIESSFGNFSEIQERAAAVEIEIDTATSTLDLAALAYDLVHLDRPGLDISELQTRVDDLETHMGVLDAADVSKIVLEIMKLNGSIHNTTLDDFVEAILQFQNNLNPFGDETLAIELTGIKEMLAATVDFIQLRDELNVIHAESLALPNVSSVVERLESFATLSGVLATQMDELAGSVALVENFTTTLLNLDLSGAILDTTLVIDVNVDEIYELLWNETASMREAMYCISLLLEKIIQINESLFDLGKMGLNMSEIFDPIEEANSTIYNISSFIDLEGMLANNSITLGDNPEMIAFILSDIGAMENQLRNLSTMLQSFSNFTSLNTSMLNISVSEPGSGGSPSEMSNSTNMDLIEMQNTILSIPAYAASLTNFSQFTEEMCKSLQEYIVNLTAVSSEMPATTGDLTSSLLLFQRSFNALFSNVSTYLAFYEDLQDAIDNIIPQVPHVRNDLTAYETYGYGNESMQSTVSLEAMVSSLDSAYQGRLPSTYLEEQLERLHEASLQYPDKADHIAHYEVVDEVIRHKTVAEFDRSVLNLTRFAIDVAESPNFFDLGVSLTLLEFSFLLADSANQTEEAVQMINESKVSVNEMEMDQGSMSMNFTSMDFNLTEMIEQFSGNSTNMSSIMDGMDGGLDFDMSNMTMGMDGMDGMMGNMSFSAMMDNMTDEILGQVNEFKDYYDTAMEYKSMADSYVDTVVGLYSSYYTHYFYEIGYYILLLTIEAIYLNLVFIWILGLIGILIRVKSLTRIAMFSLFAVSFLLCALSTVMIPGTVLLGDFCEGGVVAVEDAAVEYGGAYLGGGGNTSYVEQGVDAFEYYALCNASDPFNVSILLNDTKYMVADMISNFTDFDELGIKGELMEVVTDFIENVVLEIPPIFTFVENIVMCNTVATRYSVISDTVCSTFLHGSVVLWVGNIVLVLGIQLLVIPMIYFSIMTFRLHKTIKKKKGKDGEGEVEPIDPEQEENLAEEHFKNHRNGGIQDEFNKELMESIARHHEKRPDPVFGVDIDIPEIDDGFCAVGVHPTEMGSNIPQFEEADANEYFRQTRTRRSFSNASVQSLHEMAGDFSKLGSTADSSILDGINVEEKLPNMVVHKEADGSEGVSIVNVSKYHSKDGYNRLASHASSSGESAHEAPSLNINQHFIMRTDIPDDTPLTARNAPPIPDSKAKLRQRSASDAAESSFRLKYVDLVSMNNEGYFPEHIKGANTHLHSISLQKKERNKSQSSENLSKVGESPSRKEMYINKIIHPVKSRRTSPANLRPFYDYE